MSQGVTIPAREPVTHVSPRSQRPAVPLSEVAAASRQRDALYLLSDDLHRTASLPETFDAAMDAICTALNCERSAILLFDENGVMQFAASRGLSQQYRAAVAGHSPWNAGDIDARPIAIADVERSDLEASLKATVLNEGIRATAFIPLVAEGALIGKFMAYFREPYEFTHDDLAVSLVIARQLAFAVQRNRTDQHLREREAWLAEELAATRRREERLRILTQLLTDVPWESRADGAFAGLQIAWENYTGQSWDQHAGHGWFDAIHPDDRGVVQASWAAACFEASAYECKARLWHAKSQQHRLCVFRATPIRDEDGSVREWVGSCTAVLNEY